MENEDESVDSDVTVVVSGVGARAEEVEDAPPVVVVVPEPVTPEEGPSTAELIERIVNLERDVAELRAEVWGAAEDASEALDVAEVALAVADVAEADAEAGEGATDEAIDDAIEELSEEIEEAPIEKGEDGEEHLELDPITPSSAKVHPLFRPASDWFPKR